MSEISNHSCYSLKNHKGFSSLRAEYYDEKILHVSPQIISSNYKLTFKKISLWLFDHRKSELSKQMVVNDIQWLCVLFKDSSWTIGIQFLIQTQKIDYQQEYHLTGFTSLSSFFLFNTLENFTILCAIQWSDRWNQTTLNLVSTWMDDNS